MGSLAEREREPREGETVQGILVTHNFQSRLVAPQDLAKFTPLRLAKVQSKLHVPFGGSIETLRVFWREMFAGVTEETNDAGAVFHLGTGVSVSLAGNTATVEWEASPQGDVVADAAVALLMHAQSSAASIRMTSKPCRHPRDTGDDDGTEAKKVKTEEGSEATTTAERLRYLYHVLKDKFETVEAIYEGPSAVFEVGGETPCTVQVLFEDDTGGKAQVQVECADEKLATNVRDSLRTVAEALLPIPLP